MTIDELKTCLDNFREYKQCYVWMMESYNYRLQQISEYDYAIVGIERDFISQSIRKETDKLKTRTETVEAWSELIQDDLHRQIFRDRYINNLNWEYIADKYCYTVRSLYRIVNNDLSEIVSRTLFDLNVTCSCELLSSVQ